MTQTDISTATEATVERYLTFLNTAPGPEQERLTTSVFREDVDERGPLGARTGTIGVLQLSLGLNEHLGDVTFRVRTMPQTHHDRVRLQWEVLRGEESFAEGTNMLAIDEHGLIESVTTFSTGRPKTSTRTRTEREGVLHR